ncbi:PF08818 domain protein [Leptospira inadai serovar Lyme str. 10]|uniref:PF08818 domain protein n=2 Tax=Leptospira inadai serovar Lyme TaxID=293084 RepID=V6H818_9LEPT|nr:DUF1801 domain-containing protein [Leptospira inadai]EQA34792.1 PF08818 domain protein [Leptospira inadai serovar Lyme str. 10]PNV71496.1 DUF1801 domain-containing protein [Leptospira inadai serovar Lyme]
MAESKTKPGNESVSDFLKNVGDESVRTSCKKIYEIMKRVSKEKPVLWGGTMIGFGKYHYVYESGRQGDMFLVGFSPRKSNITIYIMPGFKEYEDLLGKLGKYKTGKGCLYLRTIRDVNVPVLEELIKKSFQQMRKKYPK